MKLSITKTFDFAHGGHRVVRYEAGQEIEAEDQELVDVATAEGWAEPEGKAQAAAPENKDAAGKRQKKA